MTEEDRPAFNRALQRLEKHFNHYLADEVKVLYFDILSDQGMTLEDVALAIEHYINPPWPSPAALKQAHVDRVERLNDDQTRELFGEVSKLPDSERRDELLRQLGYGKTPPSEVPKRKM